MKVIRYFTKHSPRSIRAPHWATPGWLEETGKVRVWQEAEPERTEEGG